METYSHAERLVFRILCSAALAVLLLISARFATTFPNRISVLPSLQVDAQAYDAVAVDLSNRWAIDAVPPLQPPGFVSFLAVVFTVFGHSWIAGRLSLWLCLVLITVASGLTARAVYGREGPAWCASLLCASSPALRAYTGTLQYEVLVALALLLLVGIAHRVAGVRRWGTQLAAVAGLGVAVGAVVLIREVVVVVAPVLALYLGWRIGTARSVRHAGAAAVIAMACSAALPLAWSTLQSLRVGRPVAISDKGPAVLAFGNNPLANGTFNASLAGVGEPAGWRFIVERPGATLRLALRKALYFWGVFRDGWNVPQSGAPAIARVFGGAVPLQWVLPWTRGGWLLVWFLGALLFWPRETWKAWWHLPAMVLAIMLVHLLTLSSYRFAIPTLPLVFTAASGPLATAGTWLWSQRPRPASVAIALAALCGVTLMQFGQWALVYELPADTLDGRQAQNRPDERTGQMLRVADVGARRPVLLLTDEYFPVGEVATSVSAQLTGGAAEPAADVFRLSMTDLKGDLVCERTVRGDELETEQMTSVITPCRIDTAGLITVTVETLGTASLAFGSLRFEW